MSNGSILSNQLTEWLTCATSDTAFECILAQVSLFSSLSLSLFLLQSPSEKNSVPVFLEIIKHFNYDRSLLGFQALQQSLQLLFCNQRILKQTSIYRVPINVFRHCELQLRGRGALNGANRERGSRSKKIIIASLSRVRSEHQKRLEKNGRSIDWSYPSSGAYLIRGGSIGWTVDGMGRIVSSPEAAAVLFNFNSIIPDIFATDNGQLHRRRGEMSRVSTIRCWMTGHGLWGRRHTPVGTIYRRSKATRPVRWSIVASSSSSLSKRRQERISPISTISAIHDQPLLLLLAMDYPNNIDAN